MMASSLGDYILDVGEDNNEEASTLRLSKSSQSE